MTRGRSAVKIPKKHWTSQTKRIVRGLQLKLLTNERLEGLRIAPLGNPWLFGRKSGVHDGVTAQVLKYETQTRNQHAAELHTVLLPHPSRLDLTEGLPNCFQIIWQWW